MPFHFDVPMPDGSTYKVTRLLAKGKSNIKTAKSDAAGTGYLTSSLSFAPASVSGFNVCPSASAGCIAGCLYTSGRAQIFPRTIKPSRVAKTRFFKLYKDEFLARLNVELANTNKKTKKLGLKLCVRLNIFSDILWEKECPSLFERFSDVVFYDYTKHVTRMNQWVNGALPPNSHLTFSRSENNWGACVDFLSRGANVAVPFDIKRTRALPTSFEGYPVIDGDLTDLRFLDPQGGYIIGLRAKGEARGDKTTGFVVNIGGLARKAVA